MVEVVFVQSVHHVFNAGDRNRPRRTLQLTRLGNKKSSLSTLRCLMQHRGASQHMLSKHFHSPLPTAPTPLSNCSLALTLICQYLQIPLQRPTHTFTLAKL